MGLCRQRRLYLLVKVKSGASLTAVLLFTGRPKQPLVAAG